MSCQELLPKSKLIFAKIQKYVLDGCQLTFSPPKRRGFPASDTPVSRRGQLSTRRSRIITNNRLFQIWGVAQDAYCFSSDDENKRKKNIQIHDCKKEWGIERDNNASYDRFSFRHVFCHTSLLYYYADKLPYWVSHV